MAEEKNTQEQTPDSCTHDCSSCGSSCSERQDPQSFLEKMNEKSDVKKVIAVVSGKGGVGKSLVTSLLAAAMQRAGKKTAVLDADITGPSIPKAFGITEHAYGDGTYIYPAASKKGTKIISTNMLLENEDDPVIWRAGIINGVVKQFWTEVAWGDVDYMFVDMPPGTGDVPLTVFQSLPVNGIIIVTSPQELVSMIVTKAVKMAEMMNIPVLGIVENMSYYECPDCGKRHSIFGVSNVDVIAAQHSIFTVSRIPIDPEISALTDEGSIEDYNKDVIPEIIERLESL